MQVEPHDLDHEFPEFTSLIHELKENDESLAHLFDEYERVNAQIVDIEENEKPCEYQEFEIMKKQRLRLKDQIYMALRSRIH